MHEFVQKSCICTKGLKSKILIIFMLHVVLLRICCTMLYVVCVCLQQILYHLNVVPNIPILWYFSEGQQMCMDTTECVKQMCTPNHQVVFVLYLYYKAGKTVVNLWIWVWPVFELYRTSCTVFELYWLDLSLRLNRTLFDSFCKFEE